MATVTEMRTLLRESGEDVPARGVLSPEWVARYEALSADEPDSADGWPEDSDDVVGGSETVTEIRPEVRPSRPRASSRKAASDTRGLVGRLLAGGAKTGSKSKAKQPPRVSLEKLTGRMYSTFGRVLQPLSPAASNCIQIQAPMAGVILEDKIKHTVADRLLQPVARVEDALDTMFALVAPPLACIAIEMSYMQEQTPQVLMRRTIAGQILREGLRTGLELSEQYGDQIAAAVERQQRSDAQVDALIAQIFPPPPVVEMPDGWECYCGDSSPEHYAGQTPHREMAGTAA